MPDVLVEVRGTWLGERKASFLDAIHSALVEALKVLPDDKVLRLIEHARDQFTTPQQAGERYTRVEIVMFAGRSASAKRALYKTIVRNLEAFDVSSSDVKIVLVEVSPENVGIRGGKAASDVDLGYEIKV
jgi:phenylpyruvate tautomerase PptA (4-oxalocrotonate tautomerase family)